MSDRDRDVEGGINRRWVLKMTGAAAVSGVAAVGTASAHELESVRFCGCSTICFTGSAETDDFDVKFAEESSGGFTCYTETFSNVGSDGKCVDAPSGD